MHIIVRNNEERLFSYNTDSVPRLEDILEHINGTWRVTRVQRDIYVNDHGTYFEDQAITIQVVPTSYS